MSLSKSFELTVFTKCLQKSVYKKVFTSVYKIRSQVYFMTLLKKIIFYQAVKTDKPNFVACLVFVFTAASFIAELNEMSF